jgi:hypothetical protein
MWHQHQCPACGQRMSHPGPSKAQCPINRGLERAPLCAGCEIRALTRAPQPATGPRVGA